MSALSLSTVECYNMGLGGLALQVGVVIKQQNLQNHAVFGQLYEHNGYVVNNQNCSY